MTTEMEKTDARTTAETAVAPDGQEHERVPEGAENIEHTLRRLAAEKAEKRKKNPGLYL